MNSGDEMFPDGLLLSGCSTATVHPSTFLGVFVYLSRGISLSQKVDKRCLLLQRGLKPYFTTASPEMYNKIGKVAARRLTSEEIQSALAKQLQHWTHSDNAIHREFKLSNFEQTWAFLNQVAMRSHLWGHHPTITTTYNKVQIMLTTHDAPGITDIDIKLARQIEGYNEQLTK